jgi:hypothetical protein
MPASIGPKARAGRAEIPDSAFSPQGGPHPIRVAGLEFLKTAGAVLYQ